MENPSPTRICGLCGTFNCPFPQHKCFGTQETLDNILSFVSAPGTLYSVALVNRTLTRAVHHLWRSSQDSYIPLLYTLPPDAYEIKVLDGTMPAGMVAVPGMFAAPTLVLTRDLCPADLDRFAFYASRIRSLDFTPYPKQRKRVSGVVLEPLQSVWETMPRPRAPLLPQLHHLGIRFDALVNESFEYHLLIGAPITSFNISLMRNDVDTANWDKLTEVLSSYCYTLKAWKIVVASHHNHEAQTFMTPKPALMGMYCTLGDDLRVFDAPRLGICCVTLAHLAGMPHLRKFIFSIDPGQLVLFTRGPQSEVEFPALEELEIETGNLGDVVALLQRLGMQGLRKLTVVRAHGFWDIVWELDPFFDVVGRKAAESQSFTVLKLVPSITTTSLPLRLPPISVITDKTMRPLYRCRTLEHLEMGLGSAVLVHDAGLVDMAIAWPRLRVLKLVESTTRIWPNATFGGLLQLVSSCQALEALSIRINGFQPVSKIALAFAVPNSRLKNFNACTSPVSGAKRTARMIRNLMPSVSNVQFGWRFDDGSGESLFLLEDEADEQFFQCWCEVSEIVGKEVDEKKKAEKMRRKQIGFRL
ncbi:hypothetical protein Hypma_001750 [Hypsizygus marmoreus]|uniref:F-box domain-containing protein n=1 Tax=Hypsizygus marmoreus TaxID=39966 RepID=A0A369JEW3_HYPMA|nr:hypothetical protein Hypma_001750 [Hypsizygus marmoreus]